MSDWNCSNTSNSKNKQVLVKEEEEKFAPQDCDTGKVRN